MFRVPQEWALCIPVLEEEKGKGKKQQVVTSAETQLSEFAVKFESDFSLVSCLSINIVSRSAWYLYSGASHHMTKSW